MGVKGRANDCMQTRHYQITICQLRKKLVKRNSEHEYRIYPVFLHSSESPKASSPKPSSSSGAGGGSGRKLALKGASGRIEALGHQQVVCFSSLFCKSETAKAGRGGYEQKSQREIKSCVPMKVERTWAVKGLKWYIERNVLMLADFGAKKTSNKSSHTKK